MDFRTESLADLAGRVRSKEVSARELTSHALGRIEALNPQVNAFVAVDGDRGWQRRPRSTSGSLEARIRGRSLASRSG